MPIIVLVGIPGCGKSSILKEALRQVPSLRVVNYGDKMIEEGSLAGFDRDNLRKMPIADQQKIGLMAAQKIAAESVGITIVDTHALVRTPLGFCPGLPRNVLDVLSPKAFAWVECSPSIILARRSQDNSRTRDIEAKEGLAMHQELTRDYLTSCSMATGAILCPISNDGPSIAQNVLPLIRLVQSL